MRVCVEGTLTKKNSKKKIEIGNEIQIEIDIEIQIEIQIQIEIENKNRVGASFVRDYIESERWGAGVEYHFQEFNLPYAPS